MAENIELNAPKSAQIEDQEKPVEEKESPKKKVNLFTLFKYSNGKTRCLYFSGVVAAFFLGVLLPSYAIILGNLVGLLDPVLS